MEKILLSLLNTIYEYLFAIYRDLSIALLLIKIKKILGRFEKDETNTFKEFQKLVRKHPNKPCIVYTDKTWTFKDLEDYCNKVANLFSTKFHLKKGDSVALFLENKPEYVGLWLGLSKLGVISALINTNLKGESLVHSITVSNAKIVVFSSSLEDSIEAVKTEFSNIDLIIEGDSSKTTNAVNLDLLLKDITSEFTEPSEKITSNDTMLYIYTSGTTGLPKPAIIKQSRFYGAAFSFFDIAGLNLDDIIYVTLPIYHTTGIILGVGLSLTRGATIVLRKKFSASNFWRDCIENNCTAFIYVGEICRYLVNQPQSDLDRTHKVRKAFGNGLRANVWTEFSDRFNVKCVEFYGASEGNCTMINRVGSCGFIPILTKIYRAIYPVYLIKIDTEMNPVRNEKGYCIECKAGEKVLLIGMIGKQATSAYNGYANNEKDTNKKIIENVFKPGQRAFNSGDMMISDRYGYVYFCDRLGDTYRWRGENVATIEVENVISKNLNSSEVVVYGVEVPGQEGRAGMAALKGSPSGIDLGKLARNLKDDLPLYSRPLFIRFVSELEHTGTFKVKKTKLVQEAYNVKLLKDKIFYMDTKEQIYKELDKIIYENILKGLVRL